MYKHTTADVAIVVLIYDIVRDDDSSNLFS